MTVANVRYIANGFIVTASAVATPQLQSVYATTIPEVVYWIGRIFDPIANAAPLQNKNKEAAKPRAIDPPDDPLLGQQASVSEIASGGFLVTQMPPPAVGGPMLEIYCTTMDAVADLLTQIFSPPEMEEVVVTKRKK